MASEMDQYNNKVGSTVADVLSIKTHDELVKEIAEAIRAGKLKILKKDSRGNFLDCKGNIISSEELLGKWETAKCLVNSDEKAPDIFSIP
jgi:hypothetical protein